MDKKDAIAVILILAGLGTTQLGGGPEGFYVGLGWGTIGIASIWLAISIRKELKKGSKKT